MENHGWATASNSALATIDPRLHDVCDRVLFSSRWDLMAREGRRDRETQERYFAAGLSKARWGQSRHNAEPPELSRAIHLIPLPFGVNADGSVNWDDLDWRYRCAQTAALVDSVGRDNGLDLVWGGWWPSLRDLCHFEMR